jgi:transposase
MLRPPSITQIFVCLQPVDLRRGFDGLAGIVGDALQQNPTSGALYVFRNRRADRIKLLHWDRDGYVIWYKRLEKGTFQWPSLGSDSIAMTVSSTELIMILDGIELSSVRKRPRYQRSA